MGAKEELSLLELLLKDSHIVHRGEQIGEEYEVQDEGMTLTAGNMHNCTWAPPDSATVTHYMGEHWVPVSLHQVTS